MTRTSGRSEAADRSQGDLGRLKGCSGVEDGGLLTDAAWDEVSDPVKQMIRPRVEKR